MLPTAGVDFYNGTQGQQGGGGSENHSELSQLDYASAGHTGFAQSTHSHSQSDITGLTDSLALKVNNSVSVNVSSPLSGGGGLTQSITISMLAAYQPRERLTAARTYYVRTDGNDANTGLVDSAGGAFLTIQAAVSAYQALDCNGYDVTIQIRSGTYTAGALITARIGAGNLYVIGDLTIPTNVLVSVANNHCFHAAGHPPSSLINIRGFELRTSGSGDGLRASFGSIIQYKSINFGACASYHIEATRYGIIFTDGDYVISGGASGHIALQQHAVMSNNGAFTLTLSGTPNFTTAFVVALRLGFLYIGGVTFSGSATGSRYKVDSNAVVDTTAGGATYLPGNAGGTTSTGGQYL